MKEHIEAVKTFMEKAGQNVPAELTRPDNDTLLLRAKLAMEECLELCDALGVTVGPKSTMQEPITSTKDLEFVVTKPPNPIEALDAAVDSLWVSTTGVAAIFGLLDKLEAAVAAVDENNLEKFKSGYKCPETGKWIKDKNHKKVDLESIIREPKN